MSNRGLESEERHFVLETQQTSFEVNGSETCLVDQAVEAAVCFSGSDYWVTENLQDSPSIMWVRGTDLGHQAWQQTPLPVEPSHWATKFSLSYIVCMCVYIYY